MAKVTLLECDQCGSREQAETYMLWRQGGQRAAKMDLCVECAKPYEAVFAAGGVPVRPPGARLKTMRKVELNDDAL